MEVNLVEIDTDESLEQKYLRLIKRRILFTKSNDLEIHHSATMSKNFIARCLVNDELTKKTLNAEVLLNALPVAEALAIFKKDATVHVDTSALGLSLSREQSKIVMKLGLNLPFTSIKHQLFRICAQHKSYTMDDAVNEFCRKHEQKYEQWLKQLQHLAKKHNMDVEMILDIYADLNSLHQLDLHGIGKHYANRYRHISKSPR